VRGRVQGVGYRYYVSREAESLDVAGFVRNLPDGSVEVVAEAPEGALTTFEERLREGPAFAAVASVERTVAPLRDGERGFEIR
jgi:acylphosphatase